MYPLRPLIRPRPNHACHQKPNLSRETVLLKREKKNNYIFSLPPIEPEPQILVFHVQALAEEVVNLTNSCTAGEGGLKVGGVFFETSFDFSK
jgi:hypothetical protein